MSKKHKNERGPLTPRKSGAEPKAILVSYTTHDVEKGRMLTDQVVVAAAQRIIAGAATALEYNSPIHGNAGDCWATVQATVEKFGGRMRTGWLVSKQPITSGRNRMAVLFACCHAIWEHDGRLIETIPDYEGQRFVLDDAVPPLTQYGINFLDAVIDARRCSFGISNLFKKVLPLAASR